MDLFALIAVAHLHKTFINGLEFDAMSFAWPVVVRHVGFFNSGLRRCRISQEDSSLCFHYGAWIKLVSHYTSRCFYVFLY